MTLWFERITFNNLQKTLTLKQKIDTSQYSTISKFFLSKNIIKRGKGKSEWKKTFATIQPSKNRMYKDLL